MEDKGAHLNAHKIVFKLAFFWELALFCFFFVCVFCLLSAKKWALCLDALFGLPFLSIIAAFPICNAWVVICSLRDKAQVEQLLRYVVEEVPEDSEKKRSFKYDIEF